ncbi:unnamed protein product, partial [Brassica oleracea]
TLVNGGRLLHQYVVDVFTAIKEDRLRWARNNQDVLRAELYSNVLDAINKGDTDAKNIGQRTPSAEEVDEIISAELPNKEEDSEAYNLVTKHMIHGPCGVINQKSPCMENNVCTKKYPRPYNGSTSIDKSGYVLYRRRRNENESVVKNGAILNNTFVVPHNIKHLKKYEAHIIVEWCNRTSAVKYLFKYITKGVDRASAVIEKRNTTTTSDTVASSEPKETVVKQRNEIQDYINAQYLSACESMWQTFAFHIHKRKPSVEKLIIHLEGEHN